MNKDFIYFIDRGEYDTNKNPEEIYIRMQKDGEVYDICNFACCELSDPLAEAIKVCTLLNKMGHV